jgi:hypothetical protein
MAEEDNAPQKIQPMITCYPAPKNQFVVSGGPLGHFEVSMEDVQSFAVIDNRLAEIEAEQKALETERVQLIRKSVTLAKSVILPSS